MNSKCNRKLFDFEGYCIWPGTRKRSKGRILNYFKHRITLRPLKGFYNLISRLVHRSCGHTDLRYLFLKLRRLTIDFSLQT